MKKRITGLAGIAAVVMLLGGCGAKSAADYVTLGDYGNLEVTMATVGVDEAELMSQVNDVYAGFATKEHGGITDRAVQNGDRVSIDFEGKKDGIAFEGGTAQGYDLEIGSGQFIDGFEDGLVGVMPGETVDLELTFPSDYENADLAGQAVVFTVTVQFIYPKDLKTEEMDDAVVASIGIPNVNTAPELQQYVNDWLYSAYELELQDKILDVLIERSTFKKFPDKMKAPYIQDWEGKFAEQQMIIRNQLVYYGVSLEEYLPLVGYSDMEAFKADYIGENPERDLRKDAIISAIAKKEGIKADDEDLQAWLETQAKKTGYESAEQYLGNKSKEEFREDCLKDKVLHYLMDNTTVHQAD